MIERDFMKNPDERETCFPTGKEDSQRNVGRGQVRGDR